MLMVGLFIVYPIVDFYTRENKNQKTNSRKTYVYTCGIGSGESWYEVHLKPYLALFNYVKTQGYFFSVLLRALSILIVILLEVYVVKY